MLSCPSFGDTTLSAFLLSHRWLLLRSPSLISSCRSAAGLVLGFFSCPPYVTPRLARPALWLYRSYPEDFGICHSGPVFSLHFTLIYPSTCPLDIFIYRTPEIHPRREAELTSPGAFSVSLDGSFILPFAQARALSSLCLSLTGYDKSIAKAF